MSELTIVKPATVTDAARVDAAPRDRAHVVTLAGGVPAALDGVAPVISVQIADAERDAGRLLRAAEQLLPLNRRAPGVVVLDGAGDVRGVIPRAELEEAVLQMRRGEYAVLAKGLGLGDDYRPPAGDIVAPFVYWRCPQCEHVYVPAVGHEEDPPDECARHDPPVEMQRRVHGGK